MHADRIEVLLGARDRSTFLTLLILFVCFFKMSRTVEHQKMMMMIRCLRFRSMLFQVPTFFCFFAVILNFCVLAR